MDTGPGLVSIFISLLLLIPILSTTQTRCYMLSRKLLLAADNFLRLSRPIRGNLRDWSATSASNPELLSQLGIHAAKDLLVFLQEVPYILAPLPNALALVAVPRAALVHDIVQHREIQHIALARNTLAIENVELSVTERSRHLVLHNLDLRPRTHHGVAVLHRADAANVDTHRRVKLQRLTPGGRLRVAEHDADLLANLVNKNQTGARLRHRSRQLPQRLAHQPRLQAHMRIAHLAVELGLRHQRRHRVHHQHVDRIRPNQRLHNLQRLFAVVRLAHQKIIDVHAELPS